MQEKAQLGQSVLRIESCGSSRMCYGLAQLPANHSGLSSSQYEVSVVQANTEILCDAYVRDCTFELAIEARTEQHAMRVFVERKTQESVPCRMSKNHRRPVEAQTPLSS